MTTALLAGLLLLGALALGRLLWIAECMDPEGRARASEVGRPMTVIHLAAAPKDLVQRCARCGLVLLDYRNTQVVGPWEPHWWRDCVAVEPGGSTATSEAPTCEATA
jgi:hypothetical protein